MIFRISRARWDWPGFSRRGQHGWAAATFENARKIELKGDHDNYNLAWLLANGDDQVSRRARRPGQAVGLPLQERIYLIVLGDPISRDDWKGTGHARRSTSAWARGRRCLVLQP
jgi:hypothetical protein